jgi:hypothetical protein
MKTKTSMRIIPQSYSNNAKSKSRMKNNMSKLYV